MEHKAFIVDTQGFNKELSPLILTSGQTGDTQPLKEFITNHMGKARSPYTGELLECDWENELENGDVQELADFAMTCYYLPEADRGLVYSWDGLLEALRQMPIEWDAEYCILGRPLETASFTLDPGRMGTGFVQAEDIPAIFRELAAHKELLIAQGLPSSEETLYELTAAELTEAFDQLISLYKDAMEKNCGLLMTF